MKRFVIGGGLAGVALAIAVAVFVGGVGSGGSGSAQSAEAAGGRVPFQGRLEGVVTITPLEPPFLSLLIEATGNAAALGQFTLVIPHVVNPATMTGTGSYEFTAANGDMVFADFTGQASLTETSGVISTVEIATITGGTGRFVGATGDFIAERLFDRVAGTTRGSFNGTISSVGAAKK